MKKKQLLILPILLSMLLSACGFTKPDNNNNNSNSNNDNNQTTDSNNTDTTDDNNSSTGNETNTTDETNTTTTTPTTDNNGEFVDNTPKTISVSSVSLNKESLYLENGDSEILTATVSPSDATNKKVNWSTSSPSVATVSEEGSVTAVGIGKCTITATTEDGDETDSCNVTVLNPNIMDYKTFYDENNGYTSLYELNQLRKQGTIDATKTYKTWGTVTCHYVSSNKPNTYIQSTSKEGNVAAVLIYDCGTTAANYPVGSVVSLEVTGENYILYNNLPEIKAISSITKTHNTSRNAVTPLAITKSNWRSTDNAASAEFRTFYSYGPRKVVLNNVKVSSVSGNNATVILNPTESELNWVTVPLYYAYVGTSNTVSTSITDKLTTYCSNEGSVTITGYLHAFIREETTQVQILLRDPDDIVGETSSGPVYLNHNITSSKASSISGTYSTGNYGTATFDGFTYEYYREVAQSGYLLKLLPLSHDYGNTLGGTICNTTPYGNIKSISISYKTASSSGSNKPTLYFGETNYTSSVDFNYSTTNTIYKCTNLNDADYFKIEAGDCNLFINSISVEYESLSGSTFALSNMGAGQYRVNPNKYTGAKVAGETQVTVPISVSYGNSSYTINSTKTYTYYTYSYVSNHTEVVDDASMTSPIDVANYYSIFGEFPANYVTSGNYKTAKSIFENKTRCRYEYSRTDGYATVVPWAEYGSTGKPKYYEMDIDLTGSYASGSNSPNRGVGRLVIFMSGYAKTNYGNGSYAVCLFTDDHYATFQEFNNLGDFLPRFNAERQVTGYRWSEPTTYSV